MIGALGAVAFAVSASAAGAATYTFNIEHGGDVAVSSTMNSLTFEQGDFSATFYGKYAYGATATNDILDGGTYNDAYRLGRYGGGLGVKNTSSDGQHTVDGKSSSGMYNDYVGVSFSYMGSAVDVTLDALKFGYIATGYSGVNDDFVIIGDTNDSGGIGLGDKVLHDGDAMAHVDLSAVLGLTDNYFGIAAGDNGSWKLKAVTVSYHVPQVPLPAAGWMLLGGLGGIAAMRRKR